MAESSVQVTDRRNQMIKRLGIIYWQKLTSVGIPKQDARIIAVAIAKYDIAQRRPHKFQKRIICQHSYLICRAHLWRTALLFNRDIMALSARPVPNYKMNPVSMSATA